MRIETKTDNRRKMVQDIAEFTGEGLHYVGPPSFSYTVGHLAIDRDGVITSETEEGEDLLTQFLQEKGYLTISGRVNREFFREKYYYTKTTKEES